MNWLDWHAGQRSFTEVALVRREGFNFSATAGTGAPQCVRGVRATSGFLSVMGLRPRIGRDFTVAEDVSGAPNVALISENLWRQNFGGSTSVLGRRAMIDGLAREIVGVFPAELQLGRSPEVILPLSDIVNDPEFGGEHPDNLAWEPDRKSTRLKSSHQISSYAGFYMNKKTL